MVHLTFLEKNSYFNWNNRLICLFYFKKYRNFIESGGDSKSTKLISQTTSNVWAVMQRNGPPNVPRKNSYFNWNNRLICLFYFKKYRNFIESGGGSKSTKLISQTTSNVWAVMQRNGPPNVPRKKFVFQSVLSIIRWFYFKKYRNFIKSGDCSKSTKLISQTTSNVWAVMQRNGPPNVPRKKFVFQLE